MVRSVLATLAGLLTLRTAHVLTDLRVAQRLGGLPGAPALRLAAPVARGDLAEVQLGQEVQLTGRGPQGVEVHHGTPPGEDLVEALGLPVRQPLGLAELADVAAACCPDEGLLLREGLDLLDQLQLLGLLGDLTVVEGLQDAQALEGELEGLGRHAGTLALLHRLDGLGLPAVQLRLGPEQEVRVEVGELREQLLRLGELGPGHGEDLEERRLGGLVLLRRAVEVADRVRELLQPLDRAVGRPDDGEALQPRGLRHDGALEGHDALQLSLTAGRAEQVAQHGVGLALEGQLTVLGEPLAGRLDAGEELDALEQRRDGLPQVGDVRHVVEREVLLGGGAHLSLLFIREEPTWPPDTWRQSAQHHISGDLKFQTLCQITTCLQQISKSSQYIK